MRNISIFLLGAIVGFVATELGINGGNFGARRAENIAQSLPTDSLYGSWLAANHAIAADDFSSAAAFLGNLKSVKYPMVANTRNLVQFLEYGETGGPAALGGAGNSAAWKFAGAAFAAKNGRWNSLYKEYKADRSQRFMPLRIWPAVASGHFKEALAAIDSIPASASWKNMTRGAVYAATKNPKTARKFFAKVPAGFMNLGDYHLAMSFYKKYGFNDSAAALEHEWVNSAGGMYMAGVDIGADWKYYDGFQNMLAFAFVQNVSHGGEDFVDSDLLALRAAAALGGNPDMVNYYTGIYFFWAGSDNYKGYWDRVAVNPVFAPFIEMKIIETTGNERDLERLVRRNPLFMPAIVRIWKKNMQNGRESSTLRILARALRQPGLPDAGRANLLRLRAHTNYLFGDLGAAETDLEAAANISPIDAGIMELQTRVWSAQGKNLDEAYRFAISLIKAFPHNICYWDAMAGVVRAKEGDAETLEIMERIGRVAEECSSLFLHLGDLRAKAGLSIGAGQAYRRAIELSDDGLVIKDEVERKLKRLK